MVVGILIGWENVLWRTVFPFLAVTESSLAMAEISTLVAAIYLHFRTSLIGNCYYSPGISSRFELFYDTQFKEVRVVLSDLFNLICSTCTSVG